MRSLSGGGHRHHSTNCWVHPRTARVPKIGLLTGPEAAVSRSVRVKLAGPLHDVLCPGVARKPAGVTIAAKALETEAHMGGDRYLTSDLCQMPTRHWTSRIEIRPY